MFYISSSSSLYLILHKENLILIILCAHTHTHSIELDDGSISKKFLDAARNLTPEERGKLLQSDASFTEAHQELAVEGQTDANSDEPVNHHFIAFVNHNNELYELDGRKTYPVNHGPTNDDTFLQVNHIVLYLKLKGKRSIN